VAGATATAQIADTTDTTTVLLDASLPMKAADGQYYTTITASVDNEPDLNAPLVLTITDDMTHMVVGTITIPAGSSTGDALAVAVALGVEHTYSVSSASGGNYESLDISDTASTYGPANILNLAMMTNSNVRDQYILVKFDQLVDGVNHHFEQVVTLTAQGQQVTSARFDLDVGFDIDSAKAYDLSLTYMGNSAGLANEQLQITYLQVEHTVVEASHSNIKLGDANVAHDGIDITISPDSQLYTLGESDYYDRVSGAGSALDDAISGNNSDNVLSGGSGDDLLMGESGNDSLSGGAGTDALTAGDGNDTLLGGTGRDFLVGGSGSDTMTGGSGLLPDTETDVFKWSSGNTGADKITDFTLAPVASGGDVLDLTDLLVNENATASSLDAYLSFGENELGQTVITVDANAGADGGIGQTITLENIQFEALQSYVGGLGDDAAIIARLLDDGNLKTDM
jgi:Ca2+-binding RTX toxin-like protein